MVGQVGREQDMGVEEVFEVDGQVGRELDMGVEGAGCLKEVFAVGHNGLMEKTFPALAASYRAHNDSAGHVLECCVVCVNIALFMVWSKIEGLG